MSSGSPEKKRHGLGWIVLLALVILILVVYIGPPIQRAFDPELAASYRAELRQQAANREAMRVWWLWVQRAFAGFLIIALVAASIFALNAALHGSRWLRKRAHLVPADHRGLYPAWLERESAGRHVPLLGVPRIRISTPVNEAQAQIAAAWTGGNVTRLGSNPQKLLAAPETTPAPLTTNFDIGKLLADYNPETQPHYMLIGETGAGKSSAVFALTDHIARHFNSQFLIAENGGVDWNMQTDARTLAGYAALLDAAVLENKRRTQLLRTANVSNIVQLAEHLPLLVIVLEEAEGVYQRLFELDQKGAKRFRANLRDLAGQGRKQGIALIVATQTGSKEVFDMPTRNNLGNILVFRSKAMVGDWYGVPRTAGIQGLPSGTAYATRYDRLVTFPRISRPQLPNAGIYHEPDELLLVADATADGVGEDDLPDGTGYPVPDLPPRGDAYPGIWYRVPDDDQPTLDMNEDLHHRLWTALQEHTSIKDAQIAAGMQYKGGRGFYLAQAIRELGERNALPWQELT